MKKFPLWNNYYKFIMRVSLFFIMMIAISIEMAYPATSHAQALVEQPITITIHSKSLKEALRIINQVTNVSFLYTSAINLDKTVSINVQGKALKAVLGELLTPSGLKYKLADNKILIVKNEPAPVYRITGKVSDEKGELLPGVTVTIKGTSNTSITDLEGRYSINVPNQDGVLVFAYIGFIKQEVPVGKLTTIDVQLKQDAKNLTEVVVTALNINKDSRALGYSITKLNGESVNTVQTPNIINALAGKVAGVDVSNIANGVAGTKRVVIRGATSLTGSNQPLWVVDGIVISTATLGGPGTTGGVDYGDGLTGINPDDIESISVLKGNAAAALYGSRASNGVILITTKSGKNAKGKTHIDFNSSLLVDKLINPTDFQFEYGQTSATSQNALPISAADAYTSDSWGHKLDGTPAIQFDGVIRPYSAIKDNYERFFNTGSTLTNTVAVSGGSANSDYRISASNLTNSDIIPNSSFNRTSLNSKLHSKFGKLDVDAELIYNYQLTNNRPYVGGNTANIFYSLLYMPANININTLKPGYKPDGTEFQYADGISNPYFFVNKEKETDTRNSVTGSVNLNYQFTKWLYARGRFTRDYFLAQSLQYNPDGNTSTSSPRGILDQRSTNNIENNYEFLLGVNPTIPGKFTVNGFVGGNIDWRATNQVITSGNNFAVSGIYTFNNLVTKTPSTAQIHQKTNSLFGSMEVTYNKYLYLTLTGRNDWFSTLPTNNDNLFYPSAALSFVFSDAFRLPAWISFGKLRASSAQVSGDTAPGQLDLSYTLTSIAYGSNILQYIGSSNIPNKNLKPYLSTDHEFGLEMNFLNNRLGFNADYYSRSTKNDIVTTSVANSTGYSTAILNVGQLTNNGIEVVLTGTPVKAANFKWDISATFSTINSKVVSLGDGTKGANIVLATAKTGPGTLQLEQGKSYDGIYGFTYKRDAAGKIIYDNNGLPLYNANQTRLGNGDYNKLLGLSNTFTYKNFSLYFLMDGKFGASILSETNEIAYGNGKSKATLVGRENGIIGAGVNQNDQPNTVLVTPVNLTNYYNQIKNITEQFVYNASFVKLREVAFRYNFPQPFLNSIHVSNASIGLVARNLLTIYKDKNLVNIDPESNVLSGNGQGIERMVYPPTRSYGLTLKLSL